MSEKPKREKVPLTENQKRIYAEMVARGLEAAADLSRMYVMERYDVPFRGQRVYLPRETIPTADQGPEPYSEAEVAAAVDELRKKKAQRQVIDVEGREVPEAAQPVPPGARGEKSVVDG